jgi:hypothetical protein
LLLRIPSARRSISETEEKIPPALETVRYNSCIGALYLRVKNRKRRVPCRLLVGDEEILSRGCLVDVCVLHADNIKNVTLDYILVWHVLGSLDDKTEEGMADVGVNGVGEGSVDRRPKVDLLEEILSCAGNGTWKTRAVRSLALGDVREAKCLPRLGSNNCQILCHYFELV